jgi:hypothetical protein
MAAGRGDLFASLSVAVGQQVTWRIRRHPAAIQ